MPYSIFKYGSQMLTGIEDLDRAKEEAFSFVTAIGKEHIEIRGLGDETVSIGYYDGRRFHWTEDKLNIEVSKGLSFVTGPPIWREKEEGKE